MVAEVVAEADVIRAMNELPANLEARIPYLVALGLSRQAIAKLGRLTDDEALKAELRLAWKAAEHHLDERQPGRIRPCYKCSGEGKIHMHMDIEQGNCFGCGGCGVEMVAPDGKWQPYWLARRMNG